MTKEQTALKRALVESDLSAVKAMLPLEPSLIDALDEHGEPLAHVAAREASLDVLQYLVEYGLRVNLNAVDDAGRDLLHYAAQSGSVEKCRYLVERGGMSPLRGDKRQVTPYQLAVLGGYGALLAYFEQATGAPLSRMFQNPVRRGFYPDPSVVRVGEDYYMVNSTFVFFPCIPISHSRDLVHWRVIGHAIERPEWAHLEGLEGGRGYWAPDISYCNGRFYICATLRLNDVGAVRRRQIVVTSERPEGPYSEPAFFDEDGIDPSIFHDDDGRHYMLLNRGARIFEIDETGTRRLSETRLLYYGTQKRAPEGPHLLKRDGWYYLFQAEGGTGMGHRETVARSRGLMGPYTPSPYNPLVRQTDERALMQRCGHAKPISLPDGRWALVYLCGRAIDGKWTVLGRETALDMMRFTEDGWPIMNEGRGPSDMAIMPLPSAPQAAATDWMTPRPPKPGDIAWDGSAVTLAGGGYPLSDTRCRSLILRRQEDFRFTFSAALTVPEGDGEAGVTAYYDEHSFATVGVICRGGERFIRVFEQAGEESRERLCARIDVQPGARIELATQADGLLRWMRWTLPGGGEESLTLGEVTYLADEGVKIGKRFTGAMCGVYAVGTEATFDALTYSGEDAMI